VSDFETPVVELARPRPAGTGTVPGWIVWLMRLVVTLWAVLVFTQPVLAGQFLNGNDDLVSFHGMNATLVLLSAFVMLLAAILLWRPGRGAAWPIGASTLILVLTFVQAVLGGSGSGFLAVHVPLGVLLFGVSVAMLRWAWTSGIRVHRSHDRVATE
jgi:hypothetical protein